MAMPAGSHPPIYFTADMVRDLPDDGRRYEVVHGELLVTPAPRMWHQQLILRLLLALGNYVRRWPVATVLSSPADISWGKADLLQPDVFAIPVLEARTLQWKKVRTLFLAVEVLSPSTARADRFTKRRRYQEAGVPLYWVVDGDEHMVEVWTPVDTLPAFERERIAWHPAGAPEACVIDLVELFHPI